MLLTLVLAYPTVIALDWGITWGLDLYLRKSGMVPQAYLARLPDPILKSSWVRSYRFCERNRIALLWEYQICLKTDLGGPEPGCEGTTYPVVYWQPPLNSLPWWKEYYFDMPYGEWLMVVDENKQICDE